MTPSPVDTLRQVPHSRPKKTHHIANSFIDRFFFSRSALVSEVPPELGEDTPRQISVRGEQQGGGAV